MARTSKLWWACIGLAAAALALAALGGCAPAPEALGAGAPAPEATPATKAGPSGPPKYGGTLVWGGKDEPYSLDPILFKSAPVMENALLVYDRLLGWKRGPDVGYAEYVPIPALVERWGRPAETN